MFFKLESKAEIELGYKNKLAGGAVFSLVTQQTRVTWKYLYIQQLKIVPMWALEFWM